MYTSTNTLCSGDTQAAIFSVISYTQFARSAELVKSNVM